MKEDGYNDHLNLIHQGPLSGSEQRFISRLNRAIQENQLLLHYQPRFSCRDRKAHIVEALVRWKHPTSGLFYPEVFLSASEKHGLIYNLDLWVFEQCCCDLIWLRKHVDHSIRIAVNISVVVCESIYFAQKLISTCDKHGLSLHDFEFEITESTHKRDYRKVNAFCETLGRLGATFSLDDFGIGQSALMNMCTLPVKLIKIDKSFVRLFEQDSKIRTMVEHLAMMAHKMQLEVVAEGVEKETHCKSMMDIGCDEIQGFYLCRPDIKRKLHYSF